MCIDNNGGGVELCKSIRCQGELHISFLKSGELLKLVNEDISVEVSGHEEVSAF